MFVVEVIIEKEVVVNVAFAVVVVVSIDVVVVSVVVVVVVLETGNECETIDDLVCLDVAKPSLTFSTSNSV